MTARRLVALAPLVALALVTLRAARAPLDDVDVGWLIAAGRQVLAAHAAPATNALSYAAPDAPWIMHEWLYGAGLAAGVRGLGLAFLPLVAVLAASGLGALVLHAAARDLRHGAVAATWTTALFVLAFDRLTSARPLGLVVVLPALLVGLAFRPRPPVVALVLVELAWTNLHGSFPLGLVLLAAAAWEGRTRRHAAVLGGAAVATLVNPYGLRLHRLVLGYALGADPALREVRARVLEFAGVHEARYHLVVGPAELALLAVLAGLAVDALRRHPPRAVTALALVALALREARDVPLACIVGSLLLFPTLRAHGASAPLPRSVAFGALGAALGGLLALRTPPLDPSLGGPGLARLVAQVPDGARVFAPFRSAGLVLALAGERGVRTFYDARNDAFPPDLARLGLALKDGELPAEGLAAVLLRHGTTHAIVPRAAHVAAVHGDARWPALGVLEPALAPVATPLGEADGWVLLALPAALSAGAAPAPGPSVPPSPP